MWVYAATLLGAVPALWLLALRARQSVDRTTWLLALAFGVSFIADVAILVLRFSDHGDYQWIPSVTYLVSQASIIAAIFWGREALPIIGVFTVAGIIAALTGDGRGPDILLATIANWGVVGVAYLDCADRRLRWSLYVTFGIGWVCWILHAFWLVTPTWYPYQACRLVGTVLFCAASYRSYPRPTLHRAHA